MLRWPASRAALYCRGKPAPSPQALERVRQTAERGLRKTGGFPVQRRMAATRTGAEELAGHQGIAARGDSFRPVAGGAGVGDGVGTDGHGELFSQIAKRPKTQSSLQAGHGCGQISIGIIASLFAVFQHLFS